MALHACIRLRVGLIFALSDIFVAQTVTKQLIVITRGAVSMVVFVVLLTVIDLIMAVFFEERFGCDTLGAIASLVLCDAAGRLWSALPLVAFEHPARLALDAPVKNCVAVGLALADIFRMTHVTFRRVDSIVLFSVIFDILVACSSDCCVATSFDALSCTSPACLCVSFPFFGESDPVIYHVCRHAN